jgi:ApeA N-terminal domain 1
LDTFELAGEWWLPESPDTRIIGVLKYSDEDGFKLEIPFGTLGAIPRSINVCNPIKRLPIVLGVLVNGKTVTLVDVLMTSMNLKFPGVGSEEYKSLLGFIGDIESVANPQIERIEVTFLHFRDWVGSHSCVATLSEEDQVINSIDYHYEMPSKTDLAVGDFGRIKLSHKTDWTQPSVKGFKLEHDCFLILELDEPLPFDIVEERFLTPLWQFLSFCIDRRTHIQKLMALPCGQESWLEVGRFQGQPSISQDFLMEPFMLLSMQQLSERTASVLGRWLEFKGDERRAIALLVGINNDRGSFYSDLRFLAAAQALEAMSRVDANEKELNDDEFARRLSVVMNSVEDRKVREWAERKLKHANSRNASELLQALAGEIGAYVSTLAPNQKQFFNDIRENRNYYTHRDDRRVGRILEGNELYTLTQGLICLLKASVLIKLGFSQNETATLMNQCEGCLDWRFRVSKQYGVPKDAAKEL